MENKTDLKVQPIMMAPVQITAFIDGDKAAGYAMVTSAQVPGKLIGSKPIKKCGIWHIYTDKKYVRTGVATKIINYLKDVHDEIFTGYTTPEGEKLLVSCGFTKEGVYYTWKK